MLNKSKLLGTMDFTHDEAKDTQMWARDEIEQQAKEKKIVSKTSEVKNNAQKKTQDKDYHYDHYDYYDHYYGYYVRGTLK